MDRNALHKLHNLMIENDNKITIECFEEFIYNLYLENMQSQKIKYKETVIDMLKINMMRDIMPIETLFDIGVEIRPSRIHGKGVFATRNINADEFLTFYPGDSVIYSPKNNNMDGIAHFFSDRYRRKHKNNYDKMLKNVKSDYTYMLNLEYSIYGNPKLIDNTCYIGHMINDSPDFNPNNCNSYFYHLKGELGVMIRAKKNIKKDEEILLSYGRGYWIARGKSKYLPRLD